MDPTLDTLLATESFPVMSETMGILKYRNGNGLYSNAPPTTEAQTLQRGGLLKLPQGRMVVLRTKAGYLHALQVHKVKGRIVFGHVVYGAQSSAKNRLVAVSLSRVWDVARSADELPPSLFENAMKKAGIPPANRWGGMLQTGKLNMPSLTNPTPQLRRPRPWHAAKRKRRGGTTPFQHKNARWPRYGRAMGRPGLYQTLDHDGVGGSNNHSVDSMLQGEHKFRTMHVTRPFTHRANDRENM